MKTNLLYLIDPSLHEVEGSILSSGSDDNGAYVVLDQTPAYVQGGGQESDTGQLIAGEHSFSFLKVKRVDEQIRHYLYSPLPSALLDATMTISIDAENRFLNSKLHSAGHLIASLVQEQFPDLIPIKGHHYKEGSYVEFSGAVPEVPQLMQIILQPMIDVEIKGNNCISIHELERTELANLPVQLPSHAQQEKIRHVTIDTYQSMPCGGTHLSTLAEIGTLKIQKIKAGKGILRISYSCPIS